MKVSAETNVLWLNNNGSNRDVELQEGMGEKGWGWGVAVDLLPGVGSSGASIPYGSMEA